MLFEVKKIPPRSGITTDIPTSTRKTDKGCKINEKLPSLPNKNPKRDE